MGLDMYLNKRVFVGAQYEYREVSGKIEVVAEGKPVPINFKKISEIIEQAGYWRKANQIHGWFVREIQNGEDECKEHRVPFDKLMELKNLCKRVLETKNPFLLPPCEGFFFGSQDIDDYYYEDLRYTVAMLDELKNDGDYYYQSSW